MQIMKQRHIFILREKETPTAEGSNDALCIWAVVLTFCKDTS